MEQLCNVCKHDGVCKYKELFESAKKQIKDMAQKVEKIMEKADLEEKPIYVEVKCKHYLDNNLKDYIPTLTKDTTTGYKFKINEDGTSGWPVPEPRVCCDETCPNYHYLRGDKTTIGDIPCQWCLLYPYTPTCRYASFPSTINSTSSAIESKELKSSKLSSGKPL